ncbi:MAG TPA: methyltransferase domain-containing protein [Acidobacteriota bacterium]|jgi:SAM-dependent methyltransferase
MDELVRDLPGSARVLDLGAGGGSFAYHSTQAKVIAADLAFPPRAQSCWARVIVRSQALALKDATVDVAVCNHAFEHFEYLEETLFELNRVMKAGGYLWAAIPNGFCFDDDLYRFVFAGGGHVNRFSLQSFMETVEANTQFRVLRYKKLYSGLVYLNPPSADKLPAYPRRARLLARVPPRLLESILRWANYLTRFSDRYLGSHMSHYGWGIIFRWETDPSPRRNLSALQIERAPADLNVCFCCGAGHPEATLKHRLHRFLFWKMYRCPTCGKENVFFG